MNKSEISHFNFEITKKCNQKCFYCFNDSGYSKSKEEQSLEEWKNSLSEISKLGFRSVHITGGEPFLHPNAIEIIEHSLNLGLNTTILSNGLKVESLAKSFSKVFERLELAQISLDSMHPETHNSRRGFKNSFNDAMSAISALHQLNVPIEISSTVSEQNLEHLFDIANFCKSINASLIVRPLITTGRAFNIIHNSEFRERLKEIIELVSQNVKVVNDKFNYVGDNIDSERYFKEYGTVTVEATGKLKGITLENLLLNELLSILKAA